MKSTETLAQQAFLKKQRRRRLFVAACRVFLLLFLLLLWESCARIGIIDDFIFSSPSRVAESLISMTMDRSLFLHTGITVAETALAPILIVWLGNNTRTVIVAAVSVAVFGSILTLYNGFSSMDPDQIKLIYSLGGGRRDVLTKVLLPGSVPLILSNMKVNIGLCLVGVIIGEFLSAKAGLGYLIIYGSQVLKLEPILIQFPIQSYFWFLIVSISRYVVPKYVFHPSN